ncbi:hypothetical protein KO507_07615, partial [Gilvimarinus agarilyticus]|nr:hypothetical protein [Gilvimarinus agarilyticus]
MEENFKKRNEDKDLIKRYELHKENKEAFYFSTDEYEQIVHHYIEHSKFRKALKALSFAMDQHPYAAEFMILKAQTYSSLEEYGLAIKL